MNESPLISVITITYNAAQELPATVDSVKAQTFRDFEHLIVDGASKDATLAIASAYGGARILSEPDKGLYDAMNKGLRLARGKYVVFLNAGDAFHSPRTLEKYAKAAREGADIVYSDTVIVDKERRILGPRHLGVPERLDKTSFSRGMLVCHQAFMTRKTLAPKYDLQYRFSADYDWTVKCIERSDPAKNINLHIVGIDYLSDGLTDKNKLASLKERFWIMTRHYGLMRTILNHIGFITRALKRGRV